MSMPDYPGGIWLVDFEFCPARGNEGNVPVPLCMVAKNFNTGHTLKLWQNDLLSSKCPPFPVDNSSLTVVYHGSAAMSCFIQLGWATPVNILDLFICFRMQTNGKPTPSGNGLTGAMSYFGLDTFAVERKLITRELVLSGGPWTQAEERSLLDNCESDVEALGLLLVAMEMKIDWPRANLHGQYSVAVAKMEGLGVPLDTETLYALKNGWNHIKTNLIAEVDVHFGVYEGNVFKLERFEKYLSTNNINWPRNENGFLNLEDKVFKDMVQYHNQIRPLQQLRSCLGKLRVTDLTVGDDGRGRSALSMYSSKTGRNQPSSTRFIFGNSSWLRSLIKPCDGYGLAYVDWSQQEFGIAAALSNDTKMLEAYSTGDAYLALAKQTGKVPISATKESHGDIREQFKACMISVQYGMGENSLALKIKQSPERARELLELHRQTYKEFWRWSESSLNQALLSGKICSVFGWQLFVHEHPNLRSLGNFPMQSNAAEMLRLACCNLTSMGMRVCAPVHDALLIEAPLDELDQAISLTQNVMQEVSSAVLGGFRLRSDVKTVRFPDRFNDPRGTFMWNKVMNQLNLKDRCLL